MTEIASSSWHTEWAGSGVPVEVHPATQPTSDATCGACNGINTLVIWALITTTPYGPSGWGADTHELEYELRCRDCSQYTLHERPWFR